MFIVDVTLRGYRPLLNVPITELSATFEQAVQIIIGDNGSGKSSLMRELCPLPAVSSDYTENGLKALTIQHNSIIYKIISDFANKQHVHSFIKGDVELNASGKSTIQRELCEQEFGYTSMMSDLLGWQLPLTTITRIQRRDILFSLYPSSLSFIIDQHKYVSANLRKARGNFSLIAEMIEDAKSSLLTDDNLKVHTENKTKLANRIVELDRAINLLQHEINKLHQHPGYRRYVTPVDHEQLRRQADNITSYANWCRSNFPDIFNGNPFDISLNMVNDRYSDLLITAKELQQKCSSILVKLQEYEAIGDIDPEQELVRLKAIEQSILGELNTLQVNATLPRISTEQAMDIYDRLTDFVDELRSFGVPVRTMRELEEQQNRYIQLIQVINGNHATIDKLTNEIKIVNSEIARLQAKAPPKSCNRDCALKLTLDQTIARYVTKRDELDKELAILIKNTPSLVAEADKLAETLPAQKRISTNSADLHNWLSRLTGGKYILNTIHDTFMNVANTNPVLLLRQAKLLSDHATTLEKLAKLTTEREHLTVKINMLEHLVRTSHGMVSKFITEQRAELQQLNQQLIRNKQRVAHLGQKKEILKTLQQQKQTLQQRTSTFEQDCLANFLFQLIEHNTTILRQLEDERRGLLTELGKLEETLNRQSEVTSRLKESLYPQLDRLKEDIRVGEILEETLSPNVGFPHKFMITFINIIIQQMNKIIERVWGYTLELISLTEKDTLDYSFRVRVNNTEGLKDCCMCSRGEKEMIDMAWMVALFTVLKLGDTYPLRIDEPDGALSTGNRTRIIDVLSSIVTDGTIKQLFLINHFSSVYSSFGDKAVICLNSNNVVLPPEYNTTCSLR